MTPRFLHFAGPALLHFVADANLSKGLSDSAKLTGKLTIGRVKVSGR
ncbi:hypothetical protein EV199_0839 [Pseudobacter ginsenosidimutans]|uniref:Uncharacterized protein n=1 Tax=Pseudobacter ginsenosidimutans TaxID=661488 RepID=A0A4Q7N090_9BACT|nr:hypothetical protein EV199_0839 [Pseudobacter ginsenosidimutans]